MPDNGLCEILLVSALVLLLISLIAHVLPADPTKGRTKRPGE
jgi:hypothetical protein